MTTYNTTFIIAAIIGGLFVGACTGLVPFIFGRKYDENTLGIIGLIVCAICGLIGGLILAIPVSVTFSVIIGFKGKDKL